MRKYFRKTAAVLASAMVMAMGSSAAFAAFGDAETGTPITSNTSVTGPTVSFDKYLVMKQQANVPNYTFTFNIVPGEAVNATGEALEVRAGIGSKGNPITVSDAAYTVADKTNKTSTVKTGDTLTLESGYQYVDKQFTINMSGVTYTEPGIYRYVVTENDVDAENGFENIDGDTRYLDVYVESDDNGVLKIAGTVLHRTTDIINQAGGTYDGGFLTSANQTGTKPTGFTNRYMTYDLYLKKEVTGNQGDRNKYFDFTVTIAKAIPGTVYDVILPTVANHASNPATITCDANGAATVTFKLKDDQQVCIQGLTAATTYNVTENLEAREGYTTTYTNDGANGNGLTCGVTLMDDNIKKNDNYVEFTNTKNGIVPTNVLVTIAPYAGVSAAAGIGLLAAALKKRKKDEE